MDAILPYHQHLDLIDQVIRFICARHCLNKDEASDFTSHVHVKLLEEDSLILRKFKGNSTLKTYLVTVVNHLYQDYRIQRWGKWRPSAAARRLGSVAELLETLMVRDNYNFEQAVQVITTNYRVGASYESLYRIAVQLPARLPRKIVDEQHLAHEAFSRRSDFSLHQKEHQVRWKKVEKTLGRVLETLDAEDKLILKMSFWDHFTVVQIAQTMNLDPKPLYRRIKKILNQLRTDLEAEGLGPDDARDLVEGPV